MYDKEITMLLPLCIIAVFTMAPSMWGMEADGYQASEDSGEVKTIGRALTAEEELMVLLTANDSAHKKDVVITPEMAIAANNFKAAFGKKGERNWRQEIQALKEKKATASNSRISLDTNDPKN